MCLAIPAQITEIQENGMARVRVGQGETYLNASIMLLPEPAQVGDYVIVHAGFAMHKLDPNEAQESLKLFREIALTVEGQKANF